MKTIGLIGGMSWESTAVYYRLMNEMVKEKLGGLNSARLLIWSFNFEEIAALQANDDWEVAAARMAEAGTSLKAAGASALVICTNTMHKVASEVYRRTNLPVINIADATAAPITKCGIKRVGLLATRYTMEQDFYIGRLRDLHKLEVIVPEEDEREEVHNIIYNELCKGIINQESKMRMLQISEKMVAKSAQGIILGCTEINMLVGQKDLYVPVYDSTQLHAKAAIDFALGI